MADSENPFAGIDQGSRRMIRSRRFRPVNILLVLVSVLSVGALAIAILFFGGRSGFFQRTGESLVETLSKESYESKVRRVLEEKLDDPRDLQSITLGEIRDKFLDVCPKCGRTLWDKENGEFFCHHCPNPDAADPFFDRGLKVKPKKQHVLTCNARFRARTPLGGLAWREWVFYFYDDGSTVAFPTLFSE